ncbi:WXG100 family type VII secretion target [Streptomyces sp. MUM 203J]|uniref:WXG100 family type VII secretion target n=1 Tax=Streptomyces sp. MUM 203J TaxID=2791990 RepID=UPI001F038373|nr:WXG100 family type VII secretion target [Streptomyces sp. MUM 203J]MCH0542598.1 WXG100 family type VII secretion target [Streptomyces sp. MUM 203J]
MADDIGTRVKYSSLESMAGDLIALAKAVQADLKKMEGSISTVTKSWDGEAKAEYMKLSKKYLDKAAGVEASLRGVATIMQTSGTGYKKTDHKAAGLFQEG